MDYFMNDTPIRILKDVIKCKEKAINIKKGKHPKNYLPLYCGFDIETTNLVESKRAYMYIWQMSFGHDVIFGRTWQEFTTLIDLIKLSNSLSDKVHIIIWVANLSFEFQFMRKYINITRMFAKEKRKPLYFEVDNCIEFREALTISGGSLEHLANNFTTTKKLVGDLDYSIIRNNVNTTLTEKELAYCRNDVIILSEWSEYIFNTYVIPHKYVPLTKTGILRRMVKNNAPKKLSDTIIDCAPTEEQYNIWMKWLFRGGYTHANAFWVSEVVKNVDSVDITSSYPDRMMNAYFPMKFYKSQWNESLLDTRCCIIHAVFYNLNATTNHSIESESKVLNNVRAFNDTIIDNGRIRYAQIVDVWLTELDYKIYQMYYEWEYVDILEFYTSIRADLPDYLLDVLKDEYVKKATLKKKRLQNTVEYEVSKRNVNSSYGLLVTRHVLKEIQYIDNEWTDDDGESYNYNEQMEKTVLLPQWGVWVTAQARYKILSMIKKISDNSKNVSRETFWRDDVLYCDTDSIKMVNYEKHKHIIDEYNQNMIIQNKKHNSDIFNDLGTFDYEGRYTRFKTLGAKRYAYEDENGIHITVAGLPKKTSKVLSEKARKEGKDFFEIFVDDMTLDVGLSNKLTTFYNDEPHEDIVDGVLMREESSVCLYDIPFHLRLMDLYIALLENIQRERKDSKYEDRIH